MLPLDIEEITPGVKEVGYSKKILSAKKKQLKETASCLPWVPPTSNVAERLLSRAKFMMTDYRKKLSPSNFESQMFLMINKAFWTQFDVQEIL